MKKNLTELYLLIGYSFKEPNLLHLALRHSSMGKPNNERLEFLGDAILDFIIAEELFQLQPELSEGELSRLRANLVNGSALRELGDKMNIGNYLYLGEGELRSGGYKRTSILANAVEAIIGAIYLDSNFEVCRKQVLRWYKERLASATAVAAKDAKSNLQETLQAQKLPIPKYAVVKVEGAPHAQTFHVECKVNGLDFTTIGIGASKRQAEQEAAMRFLELVTEQIAKKKTKKK